MSGKRTNRRLENEPPNFDMVFFQETWGDVFFGELLVYRKVHFRECTHLSGESRIYSKRWEFGYLRSDEMVL